MNKIRFRVVGVVAVAIVITISAAAMTATEAITERQQEMKGVYKGMKAFAAIAKQEQPFDAEVVQTNAASMAEHLARAAELFPEGSLEGDVETWSKPEIWTERGRFDEIMASTQQAAVEMQSVTEAAAFMPALGKLGSGCKSCHETYRRPKD
jgi:cytochrome c556